MARFLSLVRLSQVCTNSYIKFFNCSSELCANNRIIFTCKVPCQSLIGNRRMEQTLLVRNLSNKTSQQRQEKNRSTLMYICAAGIFMGGMAYAGVPLYRMFCQVLLKYIFK